MSHVLMTILVCSTLPAIAFAAIFFLERAKNEPHDGLHDSAGEANAPPEFEVSEQARPAADVPAVPVYREKAG